MLVFVKFRKIDEPSFSATLIQQIEADALENIVTKNLLLFNSTFVLY